MRTAVLLIGCGGETLAADIFILDTTDNWLDGDLPWEYFAWSGVVNGSSSIAVFFGGKINPRIGNDQSVEILYTFFGMIERA